MKLRIPRFRDMASAGTLMACALPANQVENESEQVAELHPNTLTESAVPSSTVGAVHGSVETSATNIDSAKFSVPIPEIEEWGTKASKRFHILATKEAYGTITPSELRELAALDALRERQLAPTSIEEMLRASEARRQTDALIDALKSYVAFYDPRRRSPHQASRKAKA